MRCQTAIVTWNSHDSCGNIILRRYKAFGNITLTSFKPRTDVLLWIGTLFFCMRGHGNYVNNVASTQLIFTFVIFIVPSTSSDKHPLYNSMNDCCWWRFATLRSIATNEAGNKAVNARVVIVTKTVENGVIQCTITVSNFSIWDKLRNKSVGKLQQENLD